MKIMRTSRKYDKAEGGDKNLRQWNIVEIIETKREVINNIYLRRSNRVVMNL